MNILNLGKDWDVQVHEDNGSPIILIQNDILKGTLFYKLSKIKKERTLKAAKDIFLSCKRIPLRQPANF